MLLLHDNEPVAAPDAWTARAWLDHASDEVLRALTDPEAIAAWAPVNFEVEGLAAGRLCAGSRARVSGSIAGIRTSFEVEVARADRARLELVAHGPVSLEVTYRMSEHDGGVDVAAKVAIRRRRGLTARVLQAAVAALLNAGALGSALRRLETSLHEPASRRVRTCYEPQLAAA